MSNSLMRLLRLADHTARVEVSYDDVASWPDGELIRCLSVGLLSPGEPAHSLVCEECGEREDVVLMPSIVSPPVVPYLRCGLVGPYRILAERLQRWQMSIPHLIDAVFGALNLVGNREEIVRLRLWRLGKARWAGVLWTVYFGRALHCRDAWQVINRAAMPARSVLFAPSKAIQADLRIERMTLMFGLDTLVSWNGDQLHFDIAQVEQHLAVEVAASQSLPAAKPTAKRGSRTALIEALERELEAHLRSARDYANEALDRTGTPELLPRPTMEFLAKQLGVNKSTVSRCLEDDSAGDLRLLWDLASDIDRLLSAAGCTR